MAYSGILIGLLVVSCGNTMQDQDGADGGSSGTGGGTTTAGAGAQSGGASGTGAGESSGGTATGGQPGEAGTGGGTTTAGAGAQPGEAGSGGGTTAGAGAQPGEAGSGGAPVAGSAGQGGGTECETNADCAVFDDCCDCSAEPTANPPPQCKLACAQSACSARGLAGAQAVCRSRRCVLDVSCDRSAVQCRAATPECDAGMVPSVVGTCWGPCVAASDCREVTDCEDCGKDLLCVQNQDFLFFTQCVEVSAECAARPTCDCANACHASCSDDAGIRCFCINC